MILQATLMTSLLGLFGFGGGSGPKMPKSENPAAFYLLKANSIDGKEINFSEYKGKVLMIVNVASKCGFTPQYKDLEAIYEKYKDRGLVILGFPSNQFLSQEPGTSADIKKFCQINFGVKFPLFQKADVNGRDREPVYQYLLGNAKDSSNISWNFTKFLISRTGEVSARFGPKTKPSEAEVIQQIEALLAAPEG